MPIKVSRITVESSTWLPRPRGAALPIAVTVQGRLPASSPAVDLARELATRLGLRYGVDVVPQDTVPVGAAVTAERGGFIVAMDASQPAPTYEDGSAAPTYGPIRMTVTQPTTDDHDDLQFLLNRRRAVEDALATMSGTIGA